jgi:acylphosphatase
VAEGGRKELDELEGLLRQGPSGAMIERVDAERSAARGNFDRFEIGARHHGGD